MTRDQHPLEGIYVEGAPLGEHLNRVAYTSGGPTRFPPAPRKTCPRGKVRYDTRTAALAALRRVLDNPDTDRSYLPNHVPNRACGSCGGWHMPSKQGKPWKHGKRR